MSGNSYYYGTYPLGMELFVVIFMLLNQRILEECFIIFFASPDVHQTLLESKWFLSAWIFINAWVTITLHEALILRQRAKLKEKFKNLVLHSHRPPILTCGSKIYLPPFSDISVTARSVELYYLERRKSYISVYRKLRVILPPINNYGYS